MIVAVRCVAAVLAVAETEMEPLFEPEAGATVSHEGALLVTVQSVLEVMVKVCCWASAAKFIELVDNVRVGVDEVDPA